MLIRIWMTTRVPLVPFSNERREGANLSLRVIVLPNLESQTFVVDQLCCFKLGISVPNLKTCIPGDRSHPYRKDLRRLHLIFVVFQVEWETVMTNCIISDQINQYHRPINLCLN